jgi:Outer membrane protein beta-barrel domain
MRKLIVLCGVVLCLSMTAAAQDFSTGSDASSPAGEPAAPAALTPSDREPWQVGIGYQYQHYEVLGRTFHTNGFNTDVTWYVNDWFGVEGTAVFGFGHAPLTGTSPLNLTAKSLFLGGGPHVAFHNHSKFEPWVHIMPGWEHFRFTQTSNKTGLGSNSAFGFMGGGGVDYKLGTRAALRFQGDYIGTHFQFLPLQNSYSFGGGIVFNF